MSSVSKQDLRLKWARISLNKSNDKIKISSSWIDLNMILFPINQKSGHLINDKISAFTRFSLLLVSLKGHGT